MRPDLALQAIEAVRAPHLHGHRCDDGIWRNPHTGTKTKCPVVLHLDTAIAQIERLAAQVHDAAHSDRHIHAVTTALVSTPLTDLPPDIRDGWMHMARLAVEALAYSLENTDDLTARAAQVTGRLT